MTKPSPSLYQRLNNSALGKQFFRFFWAGLGATGAHYALMIVLAEFGLRPLWLTSALGFCFGAVLNFILARYLVFSSDAPWKQAGLRYLVMISLGLALNTLVFHALSFILYYILAQIIATGVVFIFNFIVSKFWVHHHETANKP